MRGADIHASTTDADARLHRKRITAPELRYMDPALTDTAMD